MDKLTFQDAAFLRLESSNRPFHVAGLLLFKKPEDASRNYMRNLARKCGRLNEIWPVFDKKLKNPESINTAVWVQADDYDPGRHVYHYALPAGGRMEDVLHLVSRAHEQLLDRNQPLWEIHIIEGLPRDRFAVYCKVHHALVDGVGALKMVDALFSTSPSKRISFRQAKTRAEEHNKRLSLMGNINQIRRDVRKHYRSLPEVSAMLTDMGLGALLGKKDAMALPFTAPRSIFNTEIDSHREVVVCDVPFSAVRSIAEQAQGTINDVLLAVCGGALRDYLKDHDSLPVRSLVAGLPVSIKNAAEEAGNQLSFMLSPFFTNESDVVKRLQKIIKITNKAKRDLARMSTTASKDFANLMLMPTILLTLTGNATATRPAINAIFSNVPGSREKLYMEGAELESMYPMSVITDAMAINLTVVSYDTKLCFAITTCPTHMPGIEELGKLLKRNLRELQQGINQL